MVIPRRPSLFIGSSSEGLHIAEALQANLDRDCEVVIWSQGTFGLSSGTLESLVETADDFDFAILVLTPDDMTTSRGNTQQSPRDNILLELGLFVGVLGRSRTYVVFDRDASIKMPSDMAGVTMAGYRLHSTGNVHASVGACCTQVRSAIARVGLRERPGDRSGFGMDILLGRYSMEGYHSPTSARYKGEVELSRAGTLIRIQWRSGERAWDGLGIFADNVLSATIQGSAGPSGVIQYCIDSTATPLTLRGRWAYPSEVSVSTETLTRVMG